MKRNKGNKFKSGASLIVMLAGMAVVASVFGYFVCSWFLDYVSAPQEEIESVNKNQVVQEETIEPDQNKEKVKMGGTEEKSDQPQGTQVNKTTQGQTDGQNLYVVQVGAFSEKANAQGMVQKLKSKGFTAYITSKNPYRVQAGAFRTEKAANELGNKLKQNGFPVYIRD